MPVLKKKWIAANNEDNTGDAQEVDLVEDVQGDNEDAGDEDRELGDNGVAEAKENPRKRPAETDGPTTGGLKGLGEVLLEKRKRFIPPAEIKLEEWIETNLEQRTETTIPLVQLYQQFTAICQMEADAGIMDELIFARIIKKKFGKSFGLKEGSVYKSVKELKEKTIGAAKKKVNLGGITLKEAVYEALNFYGNPWAGTRFSGIKQYIGTKYPVFRIDMRPNSLKRALEVQHYYGKLELVKGIGKCGFYRIPGGEPPAPEEKKASKKSSGEEDGEKKEENGEGGEKSDNGETTENGENKDEEAGGSSPAKISKPKIIKKVSGYSRWPHGDPKKIEDTFPLAICYQSAPKAVGTKMIRKYILDHYNTQIGDKGFKAAVERGEEKGMWENISGVSTGKLHLLMDDFDPRCDNIEDQICSAIIACHEPKSCGAIGIKKYVAKYHPEFKVEERPQNFKKALMRAVERGICLQLSGLGATGSFQLTYRWSPSPNVLAGEEDASDDEESEVEYDSDDEPAPMYVPKGSKSRGKPKIKDVEFHKSPSRQKASSKRKAPKNDKGRGRPKKYVEADSDDEDEVPAKKARGSSAAKGRGRPRKDESPQKGKKGKKRELSPLTDEEEEDEVVEYSPSKSKSRGGDAKGLKAVKGKGLKVSITPVKGRKPGSGRPPKTPVSSGKKVVYKEDSDEDQSASEPEEVEVEEYSPVKSKKGGKGGKAKKGKKGKNADSDEEEVLEYTPKKSQSRGGGGTPASAKALKSPAPKAGKKAAKSPAPKAGKKGRGRPPKR